MGIAAMGMEVGIAKGLKTTCSRADFLWMHDREKQCVSAEGIPDKSFCPSVL